MKQFKDPSEKREKLRKDNQETFSNPLMLASEDITQLQEEVQLHEKIVLEKLLKAFVATTGFNNGLDTFLAILLEQFNIPDVGIEREHLKFNIEQFLSCKVYSIYLEALVPEHKEFINKTERLLHASLFQQSVGLLTKEEKSKPIKQKEEDINDTVRQLQRDSFAFMRDFNKELINNNKGSQEILGAFLKDFKELIKKNKTILEVKK